MMVLAQTVSPADWPPVYTFVLAIVLGVGLLATAVPLGIAAAVQWRKVRQAELNHLLKQDLLARGFDATDIERVLRVGSEDAPAAGLTGRRHRNDCR